MFLSFFFALKDELGLVETLKLRLPICEILYEIFQLFHSLVYFILLSVRKVLYIGER